MWKLFGRFLQACRLHNIDAIESAQAAMAKTAPLYFGDWAAFFLPLCKAHHQHAVAAWNYYRGINTQHRELPFWAAQTGLWLNAINALSEVIECGSTEAEIASETIHVTPREWMLYQQAAVAG
jgi:hypothetical protein